MGAVGWRDGAVQCGYWSVSEQNCPLLVSWGDTTLASASHASLFMARASLQYKVKPISPFAHSQDLKDKTVGESPAEPLKPYRTF